MRRHLLRPLAVMLVAVIASAPARAAASAPSQGPVFITTAAKAATWPWSTSG